MPHGTAQLPEDLKVPLWRYMKLKRFQEMLDRKSLFFCRPDCFNDKFEGMWGVASRNFLEETLRKQIENGINVVGGLEHQLRAHKRIANLMRGFTAINCWHQNSHESDAMWRLYAGSEPVVAIRSTIAKLIESIPRAKNMLIHVGMVKYVDYDTDPIPPGNYMSPFAYKRKSFDYEREVRAVAVKAKIEESDNFGSIDVTNEEFAKPGENIPIDLSTLILSINLAPGTSESVKDKVSDAVRRSGLNVPVKRSKLDDEPV